MITSWLSRAPPAGYGKVTRTHAVLLVSSFHTNFCSYVVINLSGGFVGGGKVGEERKRARVGSLFAAVVLRLCVCVVEAPGYPGRREERQREAKEERSSGAAGLFDSVTQWSFPPFGPTRSGSRPLVSPLIGVRRAGSISPFWAPLFWCL